MSEILTVTPTERVTVRHAREDALEVEVEYSPQGKRPPAHYHPHQDEHFEILEGELTVKAGNELHILGPGETIAIPRGTRHVMWNATDRPVRAIWQTRPMLGTLEFWRKADALGGEPSVIAFAPILRQHLDEFRLALPMVIQRPLLALLSGILPRPWRSSSSAARAGSGARPPAR
jgi:quercetin dioxygenase-like cupin family protein